MIRFLIGLILVLFGCAVDTQAQDMGNAVDIVTEISPAAGSWHVTVVERTEVLETRIRSFNLSVYQAGEATFVTISYSWGNASHSINLTIVIPIPVEPFVPGGEEVQIRSRPIRWKPLRISATCTSIG